MKATDYYLPILFASPYKSMVPDKLNFITWYEIFFYLPVDSLIKSNLEQLFISIYKAGPTEK